MKAIVYHKYGPPENLKLAEVEKPTPKPNEVLVKIHAASVNSWDWDLVRGIPRIYRLLFGVFKPKFPIIGSDLAGLVEAVGKNVTRFKPGDAVLGDISGNGFGTFAEYACAPENLLVHKPASMTFEEAAALPQAGVLALQSLRLKVDLKPAQKVLINGAGGGVGTFAVQLAKMWGAHVTAVDSTAKLEMLLSIGANQVIDCTKADFTQSGQGYDLILDVVANRSNADFRRALNPDGRCVIVGGTVSTLLRTVFLGSFHTKKKIVLLVHKPNPMDLDELTGFFEKGKLKPVIDQTYKLSKTAEAVARLGAGKVKGKVVITF